MIPPAAIGSKSGEVSHEDTKNTKEGKKSEKQRGLPITPAPERSEGRD